MKAIRPFQDEVQRQVLGSWRSQRCALSDDHRCVPSASASSLGQYKTSRPQCDITFTINQHNPKSDSAGQRGIGSCWLTSLSSRSVIITHILYSDTPSLKGCHYSLVHNSTKWRPIFDILSLLDSAHFLKQWSLYIPPHLKCEATLPFQILL